MLHIGLTCMCQLCTLSHVLRSRHMSPGVYCIAYIAKVILNDMSHTCGAERGGANKVKRHWTRFSIDRILTLYSRE